MTVAWPFNKEALVYETVLVEILRQNAVHRPFDATMGSEVAFHLA